jgi:hypothetical protein
MAFSRIRLVVVGLSLMTSSQRTTCGRTKSFGLKDPSSGQAHGFYGVFSIPQNFVSSAAAKLNFTTSATTGNGRFRLTYRAVGGDNVESLDQTGNQEQVSVTKAAPGAAHRKVEASFALTSANFAVGDLCERLDDTGVDTIAADIVVFALDFEYADV